MKKLAITILSLVVVVSNNAMAQDKWIYLDKNNKFSESVDPSTILTTGNIIKMRSMMDYLTAQPNSDTQPYLSAKILMAYDCKDKKVAEVELITYSENAGKGQPLLQWKSGEHLGWMPIKPNSIDETEWKYACDIKFREAINQKNLHQLNHK